MSTPWQVGVFRAKGVPSYRFQTAIWVILREYSTTPKRKPRNINDLAVCERRKPPKPALAAPTALSRLGNCLPLI
nr:MAG TPA: hypothetical protein [Bacteriophage sp.]